MSPITYSFAWPLESFSWHNKMHPSFQTAKIWRQNMSLRVKKLHNIYLWHLNDAPDIGVKNHTTS